MKKTKNQTEQEKAMKIWNFCLKNRQFIICGLVNLSFQLCHATFNQIQFDLHDSVSVKHSGCVFLLCFEVCQVAFYLLVVSLWRPQIIKQLSQIHLNLNWRWRFSFVALIIWVLYELISSECFPLVRYLYWKLLILSPHCFIEIGVSRVTKKTAQTSHTKFRGVVCRYLIPPPLPSTL